MYKINIRTYDKPLSFDNVIDYHYNGNFLVINTKSRKILVNTDKLIFIEIYSQGED